jgi:hypothetical protein
MNRATLAALRVRGLDESTAQRVRPPGKRATHAQKIPSSVKPGTIG